MESPSWNFSRRSIGWSSSPVGLRIMPPSTGAWGFSLGSSNQSACSAHDTCQLFDALLRVTLPSLSSLLQCRLSLLTAPLMICLDAQKTIRSFVKMSIWLVGQHGITALGLFSLSSSLAGDLIVRSCSAFLLDWMRLFRLLELHVFCMLKFFGTSRQSRQEWRLPLEWFDAFPNHQQARLAITASPTIS